MMKTQEYTLDANTIEQILNDIEKNFNTWKLEHREALRIRLTIDELLLRLLENGRTDTAISLSTGKRFGRNTILIKYKGAPFNPVADDAEYDWGARILENLDISPSWNYRGKTNSIEIRAPHVSGRSTLFYITLAVFSAILIGNLGGGFNDTFRNSVIDFLLTPTINAFLGLLNTYAGIMIAFTIMSGILGVGDAASLNRIGKHVLLRFCVGAFLVSGFALAFIAPFFIHISGNTVGGESQIKQIINMVLGIISKNPIEPFLSANTLQIIVIASVIGTVLLTVRTKAPSLCGIVDECTTLFQSVMSLVCKLIPVFVFVSLLRQIWLGNSGQLFSIWKPLCLYLAIILIVTLVVLLMASWRVKVSPMFLLKTVLPGFTIALSTASSMAAYSVSVETCEKKLGINRSLIDFAFPIGIVMYMPGGVITFAVLSGYLAEIYHVDVNFSWLLMACALCAILSIAVPPIPGAMLTCYGILMKELGIPSEGLLLAAAFDIIQDFTSSGFDVLLIQLELLYQAAQLGKLDTDLLYNSSGS